jgi:hypothetical protein
LNGSLQYSIWRRLRTLPRGQNFSMFPWTYRSINSIRICVMYPAASTAKIGATVTMLTSIFDGCFSGSFKTANRLNILSWIPLSRKCVNLWRKLFYITILIHWDFKIFLQKYFSYGCVKSNEKHRWSTGVDDSETVRYLRVLWIVVTEENFENPVLVLHTGCST